MKPYEKGFIAGKNYILNKDVASWDQYVLSPDPEFRKGFSVGMDKAVFERELNHEKIKVHSSSN